MLERVRLENLLAIDKARLYPLGCFLQRGSDRISIFVGVRKGNSGTRHSLSKHLFPLPVLHGARKQRFSCRVAQAWKSAKGRIPLQREIR